MKVINLKNYGVVVFNTKLTKEAILKLTRHNPAALKLQDAEGNDTFGIAFGEQASISEYGICFNRIDNEGTALISVAATLENEEIAEKYAPTLLKVKAVEEKALAAYEELVGQLLEIANEIENPLTAEAGEDNA